MANWYYYNESGDKIEVTGGQLKGLAKAGTITPDTIVETEDGKKARAGKVKGLKFAESESTRESATQDTELPDEPDAFNLATSIPIPPTSQPAPTATTTPGAFCTYCGQPVQPTAVACMACGADPRVHRKFCYACGTPVNEVQVICTKCHTPIAGAGSVPVGQTPGQAAPMQPVAQPLGKVLASGNGKWNPIIFGNWIVSLLLVVACVFLLGFFIALVLLIIVIPLLIFSTRGIAKTEITVHENGIAGTIGKSLFELQNFQITYNEITKVDKLGLTAIVIHTSGTQYKCFVANPDEMRRVIVEQHQKVTNRSIG